ncbi:ATP-binding cassette domain-containing protein [Microbacterium sp. NPDC060132]|uniref:ABC transporter ATP-binding protein/permease n=1 Tax=unclassified Microbacterium TaxID=2609290 RepID=UPI003656B945
MPTLSLDRVSRVFSTTPPVVALDGVDVVFAQGEYVAVEGESGGGKSTLLGIVGLLDRPSSGRYLIDGDDVAGLSDRAAAAARSDLLGYIFQSFHLLDRRTVVENVELPLHYRAVDRDERRGLALRALQDVGLGEFAQSRPGVLSGGQRQRVAIARAMAARTPILLADEPTGNLDSENSAAVLELFDEVRRSGTTLIVVTHSAVVAERADRRVRVADGRVVSDGSRRAPVGEDGARRHPPVSGPHPPGRASTVRFGDLVRDAWRNVTSRPGRTLALVAALAVPLALALTTLGLASSASVQVSSDFDTVAAREVAVQAPGDGVSPTLTTSLDAAATELTELNGVTSAAVVEDSGTHAVRVGAPRPEVETGVFAAAGDPVAALRLEVDWAEGADALGPGEVLVGTHLAANLGLGPVERAPTVSIDGETFVVAGVVSSSPRRTDLLGKAMILAAADAAPPVGSVSGYLVTRAGAAGQVAAEAPVALDAFRPERFDVSQPPAPSATREKVEASVGMSLAVLTAVALVGGVLSIVLATVSSVAERRAEIGLRRALGARRLHVSAMLVAESMLLGVLGGLVGVVLGMSAILAVTLARQWTPVFDVRLALLALGGGVAIACLGAIAGAVRAGAVLPNAALRS